MFIDGHRATSLVTQSPQFEFVFGQKTSFLTILIGVVSANAGLLKLQMTDRTEAFFQ